jgi:TorA maturation chaperone TorD
MSEKAEEALARSNLYGMLSHVFLKEPGVEFLKGLGDNKVRDALLSLGVDLNGCLEGEKLMEELAVEYTTLFIGPVQHLSPHESVYKEGTLLGYSALRVRRFYERCGYALSPGFKDMPDHLGVELEFMQHLTREESRCWRKGDKEKALEYRSLQRRFLEEHLVTWAPGFCIKVEKFAEHPFYKRMAALTREFIKLEHRELKG